jgi:hypothetical protein
MAVKYRPMPYVVILVVCLPLMVARQDNSPIKSNEAVRVETEEAEIEGLYILPIGDEPFTARIIGRIVNQAQLLKPPDLGLERTGPPPLGSIDYSWSWAGVQFYRVVARNVSGKIYFEERRPILLKSPRGSSQAMEEERPSVFYIIDPLRNTRTRCVMKFKSCKIEELPKYIPYGSPRDEKLPRATETYVTTLGTKTRAGLTVKGWLETTTLVARAFGNPKPLIDQREVWHSDAMGLDVFRKSKDSQKGTVATAELTEINQEQPNPKYFEIPVDYTIFDDRGAGNN